MPGITAMTIESTGRMGSLRQATVNFRVSDKMQLDVMDALYFRPGFTLLIEYGHAKYINNKWELKSTEELMIDPFKTTDKEKIGIKISRNIQKSAGNYGGLLSIITSFNFSMTPDGGYDCVLKTIALGGVMGNYPINKKNNNNTAYAVDEAIFIESSKYSSISNKYLAAGDYSKQKGLGDIYVYVDPSTISDLFFNGSLLDENSKPVYESRADFRFRYLNWVRAIDAAPDKYIIYFRNTDEQKALPKDQRTKYFIGIEYGNDKFELDANAKTLKALANSQSALELMLRSIMLYAIDNNGTAPMTSKFIKDLFSEGAYSEYLKKLAMVDFLQKIYTR
jgi:hypothetical protein